MRVMVLTDRKRVLVTEADEKKIVPALDRPGERISVKGVSYKKTMVGYFDDPTTEELMGLQSVLEVFPGAKTLNDGLNLRCRGQYSMACEINNIISDRHGKEALKFISDKKYREEIRQELLTTGAKWCDSKANPPTCNCDDDYKPTGFRRPELFK